MPPDAIVEAVAIGVPFSSTWTVTSVFSLALPENDGVRSLERAAGPAIVTVGDSVSTSKNTEPLSPSEFSMPLFSVAKAENEFLPVGNDFVSVAAHFPLEAVVLTVAICVPASNTWTVTSVGSLAVPLNVGVVSFERDSGPTIVTVGGSVSTSKLTMLLLPSSLPMPLTSVARAVNLCLPEGSAAFSVDVDHAPFAAFVVA